jgi:hypothetical protein
LAIMVRLYSPPNAECLPPQHRTSQRSQST